MSKDTKSEASKPRSPIDFVHSLKLSPPAVPQALKQKAAPGDLPPDNKDAGYVDTGSLVSFTNALSGQNKEDVLNSMMLAQLAANAQYNRQEETDKWYEYYIFVLENIGWVIQAFTFLEYTSKDATFTMDKVVLDILTALSSEDEEALMTATIYTLSKLPGDDDRVVLFNTSSYNNKAGNFQIQPCTVDSSGQVVAVLGSFHFTCTQNVTRFLFWRFNREDVRLYYGTETVTLNSQIYSKVRQAIIDKLGEHATNFVANLDIEI